MINNRLWVILPYNTTSFLLNCQWGFPWFIDILCWIVLKLW
jgi:hypothetical protein